MKFRNLIISFILMLIIALMTPITSLGYAFESCPEHGDNCPNAEHIAIAVEELDELDIFTTTRSTDAANMMFKAIYDRLFEFNEEGEVIPSLAESWQYLDEEHKILEVTLRNDIVFHNGEYLTARDIESLILKAKEQPTNTLIYQQWAPVESVYAYDNTIVFNLYQTDNYFLSSLALPIASIPNVQAYEDNNGIFNPIGTGQLKYLQYINNDSIELIRFNEYWGNPAPVKAVTLKLIDESDVIAAIENGIVDIASICDYANINSLLNNPDFIVNSYATENALSLVFNMNGTHSAIQDVKVRQAISYALDNEIIGNVAFNGFGQPIPNQYIPDEARQLLAEAGYAGGFNIRLATVSSQANIIAAGKIKELLQEVNINVQIETYSGAAFHQLVENGDFDLLLCEQNMSKESSLYDYYHTNGNKNISRFSDPLVDQLLDLARATLDEEERNQAWLDAEYAINSYCFSILFFASEEVIAINNLARSYMPCFEYNWGPIYEALYRLLWSLR